MKSRLLISFLCTFAGLSTARAADLPAKVEFNRDIRPILSENCFQCHGPDEHQRKGKLRLDLRDSALAKKAIIPGKIDDSSLIERINSSNTEEHMPPEKSGRKLSPE